MAYALENAIFQWEDGERRLREAEPARLAGLERATEAVLDALRQRLGSQFSLRELSDLYASGTEWASDVAWRALPTTDSTWAVDAAFGRYARQAFDYAGGRPRTALS
ncbi:MAG TPA: hypothetical protein VF520_10575 [Thermoleophilaceae bacterium]|jgi:hypothetical protein